MSKNYYLFNPGRMSRKDNTLCFTAYDEEGNEKDKRFIPVETVGDLFCFGSLDANSSLYNFLGQQGICVHFFGYYENYTGSFMAKDYLLSGQVQMAQARHHLSKTKRLALARTFVEGASFNMAKTLRYYKNRGINITSNINSIDNLRTQLHLTTDVPTLMGLEGMMRQHYYAAFDMIVPGFTFELRTKRPPKNEINTLISFGNSLCYAACLSALYHTQLSPTISYLHQPGERRFSLALDLSEIFKPMLVDKIIFSVLNKRQIQMHDFVDDLGGLRLKDGARKQFVQAWEAKLTETIRHRGLGRNVSYRQLIRLECYKIVKHVMGINPYEPFRMYW